MGGLVYGRVSWRRPAAARLPYLLAGLAVLLAANAFAYALPLLAVCVAAAGTLSSPTLSTAYLAAAQLAPDGAATRATTWVNSAVNAGSSAGGAVAALLLVRAPLPLCFVLTAAVPACAALAARGRRARRTAPPTGPAGADRSAPVPAGGPLAAVGKDAGGGAAGR